MNFNFFDLFWIFGFLLTPALVAKTPDGNPRVQTLRAFEQQRRSRVILLIHRQESIACWEFLYRDTSQLKTQNRC
jgi:hypothetical protein